MKTHKHMAQLIAQALQMGIIVAALLALGGCFHATNASPIASFTFSPNNPAVGEIVVFDASSSVDADGIIAQYNWDFSDMAQQWGVSGKMVTHIFDTASTHRVCLRVTDDKGATGEICHAITVISVPSGNRPPIAVFTFSPSDIAVGDTVTFDASLSTDPDGFITSYRWDFADMAERWAVTGTVVTHIFNQATTYRVCLRVTDDAGATSEKCQPVVVGTPPKPCEVISSKKYAIEVVDFSLGYCKSSVNKYCNPSQALGKPDEAFVSLGGEGSYIIVKMAKRFANGPGADLQIYQVREQEPFDVFISSDNSNWVQVGSSIRNDQYKPYASIEIAPHDGGLYVKIIDRSSQGGSQAGADIDAVESLYECVVK